MTETVATTAVTDDTSIASLCFDCFKKGATHVLHIAVLLTHEQHRLSSWVVCLPACGHYACASRGSWAEKGGQLVISSSQSLSSRAGLVQPHRRTSAHFTASQGQGSDGAANAADWGGDSSPAQSPRTRAPRASCAREPRVVTCIVGESSLLRYGSQRPALHFRFVKAHARAMRPTASDATGPPAIDARCGGGWRWVCRRGCTTAAALRGGGRGLRRRGHCVASHPADAAGV
jgi:hypothetical protein